MDFRSMQSGGAMTQQLWQFLQMGSGVQEDTIMGLQGSDRQTAREFIGRREASGTRLMLESVIYDQRYLEPLADMFASMDLQFLEVPREVMILGDSAIMDPITGAKVDDNRAIIRGEDLVRQYSARALGTTMQISAETKRANDLVVFQTVASAGDAMLASFNLVNFLRQFLTDMGYKNVNELVAQSPQAQEFAAQAGIPGGPGGVPSDIGGMASLIGGGAPSGPTSGIQTL